MNEDERSHRSEDAAKGNSGGVGTPHDASGLRNGAGNGRVAGHPPRQDEQAAQDERPFVLRQGEGVPLPERDEEGEVVHHPADNLPLVPLSTGTPLVGRNDAILPTERAPDLPVRGLRGAPPAILKQAGGALLAVAFQAANTAKRGMEEAETDAAKAAFARICGDLVLKMYEMGYGKQVKHTFDIKSQEDLPAWSQVPADVREALERYVANGSVEDP